MLDYGDYTTVANLYPQDGDNPLSYAHLEGDWGKFPKVVKFFTSKVYGQDRDDFRHDLLLEMVKVIRRYRERGKELTEFGAMRVAKYELLVYLERKRKLTTGIDCHHCSKEQRRKCRDEDLYSRCPKAKHFVSLNERIGDGDGKPTELWEVIADDKAIDLADWLDAKTFLLGCPKKLLRIAYKRYSGKPLDRQERNYLIASCIGNGTPSELILEGKGSSFCSICCAKNNNHYRERGLKKHQKALF